MASRFPADPPSSVLCERVLQACGGHAGPGALDEVGEHDEVVQLAGLVAHVVAQQRLGLEAERLEHPDRGHRVDDDLDDIAMRNPTEIGEELEATSEDTEFGPGTDQSDQADQAGQAGQADQAAQSGNTEQEAAK